MLGASDESVSPGGGPLLSVGSLVATVVAGSDDSGTGRRGDIRERCHPQHLDAVRTDRAQADEVTVGVEDRGGFWQLQRHQVVALLVDRVLVAEGDNRPLLVGGPGERCRLARRGGQLDEGDAVVGAEQLGADDRTRWEHRLDDARAALDGCCRGDPEPVVTDRRDDCEPGVELAPAPNWSRRGQRCGWPSRPSTTASARRRR